MEGLLHEGTICPLKGVSSISNLWGLLLQGDVDKDGFLDYGEFVAISIHLRKISHDEHLQRAFQFFDKNESGFIELEELRNALADEVDTNSEEVINAIMHDVDTDKVSIFFSFCQNFQLLFVYALLPTGEQSASLKHLDIVPFCCCFVDNPLMDLYELFLISIIILKQKFLYVNV